MSSTTPIADDIQFHERVQAALSWMAEQDVLDRRPPACVVRVEAVRTRAQIPPRSNPLIPPALRFEEIRRQSEEAIRRSQELGLQFFKIEMDLAHTFLDHANIARQLDAALRCAESARQAWRAAGRTLYHLHLDPPARRELEDRLEQLWRRLEESRVPDVKPPG